MTDTVRDCVIAVTANTPGEKLHDIKLYSRNFGGDSEAMAEDIAKSVAMRRNGDLNATTELSSPERVKDVDFSDIMEKY